MQTQQEFWSDPKVWISFLALSVSIVVAVYNIFRHAQEDRRWHTLNGPNMSFSDLKMEKVIELSNQRYIATNWGYQPLSFQKLHDPNTIIVKTHLTIVKSEDMDPIKGTPPALTVEEIRYYANTSGIKINGEYIIAKRLGYSMQLQNIGKTDAVNVNVKFFYSTKNGVDFIADINNSDKTFTGKVGIPMYYRDYFYFNINEPIPDKLYIKILMSYQNPENRTIKTNETIYSYCWGDDGWSVESK